jgi:hypothetical protein
MLQIGVDGDDGIASSMLETGEQRRFLAEVSRQTDHAYRYAVSKQLGGTRGSFILAAVIDDHYFVIVVQGSNYVTQNADSRLDSGSLIECRDDDAQ